MFKEKQDFFLRPAVQKILILDFGSQFTQLIARRIRSMHVYCEIHPYDVPEDFIRKYAPAGIILSGSHQSVCVFDESSQSLASSSGNMSPEMQAPQATYAIFSMGIPILGICYGMQIMAKQLGGIVSSGGKREFGKAQLRVSVPSSILLEVRAALGATSDATGIFQEYSWDVWMSHSDIVSELPGGFVSVAQTENCPITVMADEVRHFYGVQFHPEVTHTLYGEKLLSRFVLGICGCSADWSMNGDYVENLIRTVRAQVQTDLVILGLSGGVDSSVLAALLHKAIGTQLICVLIDTGLLRKNEANQVISSFRAVMPDLNIVCIDASNRFIEGLRGVDDPEEKRCIIGRIFVEVFQEEAARHHSAVWLAQGTIYPDVVESAGGMPGAQKIKSHHNVGGLPETLRLKLLEPFRLLFKDEVRALGELLGVDAALCLRHPFPGPGLGVRVLGPVCKEYLDLVREVDAILLQELRETKVNPADDTSLSWYEYTAQAFAVFLPIRSVGVMGDGRTYEHVVALRVVHSEDFMTARWAHLPHDLLEKISNRVINEVVGVNRVVYDISSKPPATIEWE